MQSISVADLEERLTTPSARTWAASEGLIVVEVTSAADATALTEPRRRAQLRRLPAVLAAQGDFAATADLDVVLQAPSDISAVAATVAASPVASLALVELLRAELWADTTTGLLTESLAYSTLQSGEEFACWLERRGEVKVPTDPGDAVLMTRDGGELAVVLNRPHRANAVSVSLREGLLEAFELVQADPAIGRVTVSGAGNSFCSGGDLGEFGTFVNPAAAHRVRMERSVAAAIDAIAERVHVFLHGACAGAGIELPAFAHRISASADARIWLPELALGLIPGAGGTVSLPRRIGRQRTAWLALTGQQIDAETALEWGLVDEVGD